MKKAYMNVLRSGDYITVEGKEFEVKDCKGERGIYTVTIEIDGKGTELNYDIMGTSLASGNLNITDVRFVENPDDDKTFYYPNLIVDILPVLNINGEDRIVYKLMDLNDLEVKAPQVLKASYQYVITVNLMKRKGRELEVLKSEKIICGTEEQCKKRLNEIEKQFVGVDKENEAVVRNYFSNLLTIN